VGAKDDFNDPDDTDYAIDVVASKVPPALLRYDDLDNRLLSIGLCSACASNAAHEYLTHPHSKCANLVRLTLEGNPDATGSLSNGGGCP
jgi:hypothetical protein